MMRVSKRKHGQYLHWSAFFIKLVPFQIRLGIRGALSIHNALYTLYTHASECTEWCFLMTHFLLLPVGVILKILRSFANCRWRIMIFLYATCGQSSIHDFFLKTRKGTHNDLLIHVPASLLSSCSPQFSPWIAYSSYLNSL